jgi:NAD(P)-dependent dehydrogenase (short-subunit alcohol dehydrogenase family)
MLGPMHVAITGGARGIGAATAELLRRRGAQVTLGDVDVDAVVATAQRIGAAALPLDVTDRASFEAFLDQAEAKQGPLSALVNNAGIMPIGPFVTEPDEVARRQVDVNLHGVILGTKLAVARFVPRGQGHVVNIASAAGRIASLPGEATYVATKHAVVGLSEAVRCELEGTGVDCSCVLPNLAETALGSGMKPARGVKKLTAEEVAEAIVSALDRPRPEVYVPRSLGPQIIFNALLPRRVRRRVQRLLGMNDIAGGFDARARAAYEQRVAPESPTAQAGRELTGASPPR